MVVREEKIKRSTHLIVEAHFSNGAIRKQECYWDGGGGENSCMPGELMILLLSLKGKSCTVSELVDRLRRERTFETGEAAVTRKLNDFMKVFPNLIQQKEGGRMRYSLLMDGPPDLSLSGL